MKISTYSIFDKKAATFGQPFYAIHEAHALRAVQGLLSDLQTSVGQFPSDFTLYCVATFDDQTGEFHSVASYDRFVCELVSLIPTDTQSQLPLEAAAE